MLRRPGVVASLIFGPFAIMAVFGIGYRDPFRTEIVTSASSGLPTDAAFYDKLADGRLDVVRVSHDAAAAQGVSGSSRSISWSPRQAMPRRSSRPASSRC